MAISEKQVKLVETIIYQGSDENLKEIAKYVTELLNFRLQQKK
jgi:hypothetical protein